MLADAGALLIFGITLKPSNDMSNTKHDEPILKENKDRFVLFPIRQHEIWKYYKQAEASFWTAEEIDLSQDLRDWDNLNDGERHFITHVLAFFAQQALLCDVVVVQWIGVGLVAVGRAVPEDDDVATFLHRLGQLLQIDSFQGPPLAG